MHKGYSFVQYFNNESAMLATKKMHGQLIGGQIIDVNLVTDPKPYQKKLTFKIENLSSKNLIEPSENLSSLESTSQTVTSSTKESLTTNASSKPSMQSKKQSKPNKSLIENLISTIYQQSRANLLQPLVTSNERYQMINSKITNYDLMICGTCKQIFYCFELFVQHKQTLCQFTSFTSNQCTNVQ